MYFFYLTKIDSNEIFHELFPKQRTFLLANRRDELLHDGFKREENFAELGCIYEYKLKRLKLLCIERERQYLTLLQQLKIKEYEFRQTGTLLFRSHPCGSWDSKTFT